jgi:hypothetical protein
MAKIKEGMGNTFNTEILKSPLTVGRTGNEPGPDVNNNPVVDVKDPLGLIPSGGDMPYWSNKK